MVPPTKEGNLMTEIFNKSKQKTQRRTLRNNATPAERRLWQALQGRQLGGHKFRRQYSVGAYILDFYCPALKLAIEIDGESHCRPGAPEHDARRQAFVESLGIRFLRFTNHDVLHDLPGVLQAIGRISP